MSVTDRTQPILAFDSIVERKSCASNEVLFKSHLFKVGEAHTAKDIFDLAYKLL
jgi:hypothetical protein